MRPITKYIAVFVAVVSILIIWRSDWLQIAFFPVEYWTAKIEKHKELVRFYRNEVKSCRLELEKMQRTTDIELTQRRLSGKSGSEARQELREDYKITRETCRDLLQMYRDENAELEKARTELENFRGKQP